MKKKRRQTQLEAERAGGIGGSDAHHLFTLEPWGCARRLWYEKSGAPMDHPPTETNLQRRGIELEGLVAQEYASQTGRKIRVVGMKRHPEHRELLVHVDRIITIGERGPGVLEIKTMGREEFWRVKREGMRPGYILQLQHAMLVTGAQWGSFAVFHPDSWSLLWWDMERDEEICLRIRDAALPFWARVENGPAPSDDVHDKLRRLDPKDRRCATCPWRTTCQGQALLQAAVAAGEPNEEVAVDMALAPLVEEYREAQGMVGEAEGLLFTVRARLEAALAGRIAVQTLGARVYFRPQTAWRWDVKALDRDHPELRDIYKRESVSRPLRVFPI